MIIQAEHAKNCSEHLAVPVNGSCSSNSQVFDEPLSKSRNSLSTHLDNPSPKRSIHTCKDVSQARKAFKQTTYLRRIKNTQRHAHHAQQTNALPHSQQATRTQTRTLAALTKPTTPLDKQPPTPRGSLRLPSTAKNH